MVTAGPLQIHMYVNTWFGQVVNWITHLAPLFVWVLFPFMKAVSANPSFDIGCIHLKSCRFMKNLFVAVTFLLRLLERTPQDNKTISKSDSLGTGWVEPFISSCVNTTSSKNICGSAGSFYHVRGSLATRAGSLISKFMCNHFASGSDFCAGSNGAVNCVVSKCLHNMFELGAQAVIFTITVLESLKRTWLIGHYPVHYPVYLSVHFEILQMLIGHSVGFWEKKKKRKR